jgi:hypothetical protein
VWWLQQVSVYGKQPFRNSWQLNKIRGEWSETGHDRCGFTSDVALRIVSKIQAFSQTVAVCGAQTGFMSISFVKVARRTNASPETSPNKVFPLHTLYPGCSNAISVSQRTSPVPTGALWMLGEAKTGPSLSHPLIAVRSSRPQPSHYTDWATMDSKILTIAMNYFTLRGFCIPIIFPNLHSKPLSACMFSKRLIYPFIQKWSWWQLYPSSSAT